MRIFKCAVLSRNKVLSVNDKFIYDEETTMRTLNLSQIRWIMREMKKGELSVHRISKQQRITAQYCRRLYLRFANTPLYKIRLLKCGRKPTPLTDIEANAIRRVRCEYPTTGAVSIENLLLHEGIHISHNKIHSFLIENGFSKIEPRKSKRRKWIRYERKHSNSLWHTDYHEMNNPVLEGKQLIPYEDDASRLITGYGLFDNATTHNALDTFRRAVNQFGLPKQLISDHGTQFCIDKENDYLFRETVENMGTEHILARVKHPQTNGKMERFFGTIERLLPHFDNNIDKAIAYYNFRRPHMSLVKNGKLLRPYEAFILKGGKMKEMYINEQGEIRLS